MLKRGHTTHELLFTVLHSPIGDLLLVGDGESLTRIGFPSGKGAVARRPEWKEDASAFADARQQLQDFFQGRRRSFDLPLRLEGSPFQLRVWRELQTIPFGHTISYGELARRVGQPTASRAVGAANGVNPIPIVVPCHRVIGASGALTGFGGGLETKRWLLDLERTGGSGDLFQAAQP